MTVYTPDILEKIKLQISENKFLLYMKGTPQSPQCGFSAKAVQMLNACKADFISVDVLAEPDIRSALPQYANWPTFPQFYLNGELIGGCDIMTELFESGELQKQIAQAQQHR